jgi:D-tyrosyl-tRNA(Tyr) deacylase
VRVVLQRVSEAKVTVDGTITGAIGPGLLALVGVGKNDTEADVEALVNKIPDLRIFEDDSGKMNRSLLDGSRNLLAVSQFTLYADTRKGRRPSFVDAMAPAEAKRLYALFCAGCRSRGLTVAEGVFAADMKVSLVNDGPVTLVIDTQTEVERSRGADLR